VPGISETKWTVLAVACATGVAPVAGELPETPPKVWSSTEAMIMAKGEAIYSDLCFSCHGNDGRGAQVAGGAPGATMAPPLAGSRTVNGWADAPVMVLLSGLAGTVNGKDYEAQMVSMAGNPDDWLAAVTSFVRNSFGNSAGFITVNDVKRVRASHGSRNEPWTQRELRVQTPQPVGGREAWTVTASARAERGRLAIDGRLDSAWDPELPQRPGQWLQVELPNPFKLAGVRLINTGSPENYPRGYKLEISRNGRHWTKVEPYGARTGSVTDIRIAPTRATFVRITLTAAADRPWIVRELQIFAAAQ
jgi:mono/diheme cytochrome c family protein